MKCRLHGTLYIGVTSNLTRRIYEHKNQIFKGFTSQYHCKILVYYEKLDCLYSAVQREKQIKGWTRIKKITLINSMNPEWEDLYTKLF